MSSIPGYLTMTEVSERFGIAHSGVARYVRLGRLQSVTIGQQKLIPEKEAEKFQRRPVGRPSRKSERPVL